MWNHPLWQHWGQYMYISTSVNDQTIKHKLKDTQWYMYTMKGANESSVCKLKTVYERAMSGWNSTGTKVSVCCVGNVELLKPFDLFCNTCNSKVIHHNSIYNNILVVVLKLNMGIIMHLTSFTFDRLSINYDRSFVFLLSIFWQLGVSFVFSL